MLVRDLIDVMARLHQYGEVEKLADCFAEPLIVFPVNGPSRRATREDTIASITTLLQSGYERGVQHLEWDELSVEEQAGGNSSILVRWRYLTSTRETVGETVLRYFCGQTQDKQMRVLMIEYLEVAFPSVIADMPTSFTPTTLS